MSGIFNSSIFNNAAFNVGDVGAVDVVKTGTGGIDKRRNIVKPLGTLGLPKDKKANKQRLESRVEDSKEIQAEVAAKLAREFSEESDIKAPIAKMTMAQVELEIGTILRKQVRTREDEVMLILLMVAAL